MGKLRKGTLAKLLAGMDSVSIFFCSSNCLAARHKHNDEKLGGKKEIEVEIK